MKTAEFKNLFIYGFYYSFRCWVWLPITFLKRVVFGRDKVKKIYFWEKWGFYDRKLLGRINASKGTIWIIANSGGEVLQAVPFFKKVKEAKGYSLLLSTESYDTFLYAQSIKELDGVTFTPFDISCSCRRALEAFKPKAIIVIQYCDFPYLLKEAKRMGIKTFLFSARINFELFKDNYAVRRAFALRFYDFLDYFGVKSAADLTSLTGLGVDKNRISILGDMKADLEHIVLSEEKRSMLRNELGIEKSDKVFIIGSMHMQEADLIIETYGILRERFPGLKLILAPRWEKDIPLLKSKINGLYRIVFRSDILQRLNPAYDILIIDTFGEVPYLYGISSVTYIASSIIPLNERRLGHNILEPLMHGLPAVFGPNMRLWTEITAQAKKVWPACEVNDARSLADSVTSVLKDNNIAERLKESGLSLTASNRGIIKKYTDYLISNLN